MRVILLTVFAPFFFGCSEKEMPPVQEEEPDDGFFYGYFHGIQSGVRGGYFKNEYYRKERHRPNKIIKTIQEFPLYHFRFSYTRHGDTPIAPDFVGNTHILDVVLPEPEVGKEYQLSTDSGFGYASRQGLCVYLSKRIPDPWASWLVPEAESIMYAPVSEKPIRLTVNKMELTPVHKAQIVEGRIWLGHLFNTKDPTDSVEIHADFRTAMYK